MASAYDFDIEDEDDDNAPPSTLRAMPAVDPYAFELGESEEEDDDVSVDAPVQPPPRVAPRGSATRVMHRET